MRNETDFIFCFQNETRHSPLFVYFFLFNFKLRLQGTDIISARCIGFDTKVIIKCNSSAINYSSMFTLLNLCVAGEGAQPLHLCDLCFDFGVSERILTMCLIKCPD